MTTQEQEKLREAMKRNAEDYKKTKLDVHLKDYEENDKPSKNKGSEEEFALRMQREAFIHNSGDLEKNVKDRRLTRK